MLKDAVFPARCPVCSDALPFGRRAAMHAALMRPEVPGGFETLYSGLVCEGCLEVLEFIRAPYCGRCGKQLAGGDGTGPQPGVPALRMRARQRAPGLCADCSASERRFAQCRCLISYDETAREIMADIKYGSGKGSLDLFSVLAADRLGEWIRGLGLHCLVPVPVHAERLRQRGFNQAEVLARQTGALLGIPVRNDILVRNKNTVAQKSLGRNERLLNLQGAFSVRRRLPAGSAVLVVDDIYTTGSTLEACTECLLAAGAGAVYGLCVCAGEDMA